ncbi:MAG TPA: dTMP kinase [Blastocatellia bacterium]|nr:dTMP kinase [Blastocatellia bacterium]
MRDGKFITFEGIDGCGKSTQLHKLAEYLHGRGHAVLSTRDPGGTQLGRSLCGSWLGGEWGEVDPTAELLLAAADRAQHVREVILPALEAGLIVLSEGYYDSTTVYQGAVRGLDLKLIADLREISTGGLKPDLTFVFDLDVPTALTRRYLRRASGAAEGGAPYRPRQDSFPFHERVRASFLELAARARSRARLVSAHEGVEEVHREVVTHVSCLLGARSAATAVAPAEAGPEEFERLAQAAWSAEAAAETRVPV